MSSLTRARVNTIFRLAFRDIIDVTRVLSDVKNIFPTVIFMTNTMQRDNENIVS